MKKSVAVAALASALLFGQEDSVPKEARQRPEEQRTSVMAPAAAAGAAIGAALSREDRAKGAIIGAAAGGLAGLIFDQIMKKKDEQREGRRGKV